MGGNDPFPFTPGISAPARPYSRSYSRTGAQNKSRAARTKTARRGAGFGFVVNDRDEILLIQRGYGKERGKWSMPGGNQDRGESLKRTAVRETREETGIRMSVDSLYYKGRRHNFEVWKGRRTGGRIKIQRHECWDAKWFQKDMLPDDANLAFGPDRIVVGKWAKGNSGSRRVHYPHRKKMSRAGFVLVVSNKNEILLIQHGRGRRKGKWGLPGGVPRSKESRYDAAMRETHKATSVRFNIDRLYYENRHRAKVWIGKLKRSWSPWASNQPEGGQAKSRWFPIDELPDDDSLAFAVDVRTVEKWASENPGSRRVSYRR